MTNAQVIQFPKPDIILDCEECGCCEWVLHFDDLLKSPTLLAFAECAECGHELPFIDRKVSYGKTNLFQEICAYFRKVGGLTWLLAHY